MILRPWSKERNFEINNICFVFKISWLVKKVK